MFSKPLQEWKKRYHFSPMEIVKAENEFEELVYQNIKTTVAEMRRQDPELVETMERELTKQHPLMKSTIPKRMKTTVPRSAKQSSPRAANSAEERSPSCCSTRCPSSRESSPGLSPRQVLQLTHRGRYYLNSDDDTIIDERSGGKREDSERSVKALAVALRGSKGYNCADLLKSGKHDLLNLKTMTKDDASMLKWGVESIMTSAAMAKAATVAGVLGGTPLVMASAAALAPPPQLVRGVANTSNVQLHQQAPKEEDQFMELIFPGYKADTFIWNITLVQIAVFGLTMAVGHIKANPTPCALYQLGACWGPAIARGHLWRLAMPMFLHANMMHLFFNVFFQLRIGFGMERQFGRDKMRLIYLMCGVIGNLISVTLDPFKLSVGASTAGFGLIGVWIAEIVMSWELLGPNRDRTLIWILFMVVSVTTMSGMTPNMDLYGHFGGALGGFLMALILSDMKDEQKPPWYNQVKGGAWIGLATVLVGGLGKLAFKTPTSPLPDCHWPDLITNTSAAIHDTGIGSLVASMFGRSTA